MKRLIAALLCTITVLTGLGSARAELAKNKYLDAAFSLIERGNIFLERYNELTGSSVEAKFKDGVPYFFGGHDFDLLFTVRESWENTKYYRMGTRYIYGFDCSGYTRWINAVTGRDKHPPLDQMILNYSEYGRCHLYSHREGQQIPPYDELHRTLKVGDFLVQRQSTRHIMMYIGTPRDYGFTAENEPSIAEFLDYPLVIHCGPNPFYHDRFQKVIDETPKYKFCESTDGGICVSILGVPYDKIPYEVHAQVKDHRYFLIDDGRYMLTAWDLQSATSYVWYRMEGKDF